MLLRDRISAGSTTSRKPRLPMSEYQRSKPRSRKSSKAEIHSSVQATAPPGPVEPPTSSSPPKAACESPSPPTRPPPFSRLAAMYLPVSDLQVSREFYGDVLGFELFPDSAKDGGDGESEEVLLSLGKGTGMEIVLYQSDCPGGKGKSAMIDERDLKPRYALTVSAKEDVRRWEEWLRGKGVDVVERVKADECSVLFRDPDGNVGEIVWKGESGDDENC